MATVTAQRLQRVPTQNMLGENALWHPQLKQFYWIDIERARLHWLSADFLEVHHITLPERIGSFGILNVGPDEPFQFILALQSGFALYEPRHNQIRWLDRPELQILGNRFNDGRTDRQGRFWAGSMVEHQTQPVQCGALYKLTAQGRAVSQVRQLQISNGLCWSLDGLSMYHADSPQHKIWRYDFCPSTGEVSNPHLFASFPDNTFPDGATIDADDMMWIALWGAGCVVRLDRHGHEHMRLCLPVSQPSSVALGGEDGDLLFVTTSRQGLSLEQLALQPQAGDLFIYRLSRSLAVPESLCSLSPDWLASPVSHDIPVL